MLNRIYRAYLQSRKVTTDSRATTPGRISTATPSRRRPLNKVPRCAW